jgi:hypothetical protein
MEDRKGKANWGAMRNLRCRKKAILYLQHTVKNPRVQPYLDAAQAKLAEMEPEEDWRPDLKAKMYEIRDAVISEMRDCCPSCESLSIQYRKGAATWICNSKSGGHHKINNLAK